MPVATMVSPPAAIRKVGDGALAWVAITGSNASEPQVRARARDRKPGQHVRGRRTLDLAQYLNSRELQPLASAGEHLRDHRYGPRIVHLGKCFLGLLSSSGVRATR